MKHEINGLKIDVSFNRPELKEALLKKILRSHGLTTKELQKIIIDDLIDDKFLYIEVVSSLMDLEEDELISSEMRMITVPTETEKGRAVRFYIPPKSE